MRPTRQPSSKSDLPMLCVATSTKPSYSLLPLFTTTLIAFQLKFTSLRSDAALGSNAISYMIDCLIDQHVSDELLFDEIDTGAVSICETTTDVNAAWEWCRQK